MEDSLWQLCHLPVDSHNQINIQCCSMNLHQAGLFLNTSSFFMMLQMLNIAGLKAFPFFLELRISGRPTEFARSEFELVAPLSVPLQKPSSSILVFFSSLMRLNEVFLGDSCFHSFCLEAIGIPLIYLRNSILAVSCDSTSFSFFAEYLMAAFLLTLTVFPFFPSLQGPFLRNRCVGFLEIATHPEICCGCFPPYLFSFSWVFECRDWDCRSSYSCFQLDPLQASTFFSLLFCRYSGFIVGCTLFPVSFISYGGSSSCAGCTLFPVSFISQGGSSSCTGVLFLKPPSGTAFSVTYFLSSALNQTHSNFLSVSFSLDIQQLARPSSNSYMANSCFVNTPLSEPTIRPPNLFPQCWFQSNRLSTSSKAFLNLSPI